MSYIRKRKSKGSGIIPKEIITDESSLTLWISENANKLIYGGGVILLILVLSFGYVWLKARNARVAGEDLASALRFYWSTAVSIAPDDPASEAFHLEQALGRFTEVAREHRKAVQGQTASLYRAGVLFRLERYEEAIQVLTDLEAANPSIIKDLNARHLLARSLEAKGDLEKAAEIYSSLKENAVGDMIAVLTVDLARCSELAGDTERAVSLYRELVDDFPESVFALRAEKKLAILGAADREEL
jgi:tetratricopeptide (TPR) repeat protein